MIHLKISKLNVFNVTNAYLNKVGNNYNIHVYICVCIVCMCVYIQVCV